ncbi:MAG: MgtC/SapB family protein [Candidatus Methylumidiphilus sp.]
METTLPPTEPLLPALLSAFLLTLAMSFLLGLGLREYYLVAKKTYYFGSTRTCTLIGILGYMLYQLQPNGMFYLGGLLTLTVLMGVYYHARAAQQQPGMIGILIALLCYLIGPIAHGFPGWFLILFTISTLFVLNAKEKINRLTEKLSNEEIISLGKFLVLSGVILPLTPQTPIADFIPVSFHQTWLAVVVISGISYLGYLVQTYLMKGQGILLTGAIGGVYSSTATTVVLARQSKAYDTQSDAPAAAIVLATALMYPRLLAVVGIFKLSLAVALLPAFLGLAALSGGLAFWLNRGDASTSDTVGVNTSPTNPLELTSALLFAFLFVVISAVTKYSIGLYADRGLIWMSFFAGFADIDPFVLSLVQGKFVAGQGILLKAIVTATASNNLLKAVYAFALGSQRTGRLAGSVLVVLSSLTLAYGFWVG